MSVVLLLISNVVEYGWGRHTAQVTQHIAGINYTYEVDRRVPTRTHVERPATSIRINHLADDSIKHIIPYRIQVKRKAKKARYSEWFTGHHA
jgi:hypothetical protein